MNSRKKKRIIKYVLLISLAIIWVIPIFTLFATAVKSKSDFYSGISLFELPESLTLNDVEHELSFQPVGLRLLFAARLMEFSQRIEDSGTLPTYRNLRQFLFHELYENHPEKISWKYPH